jgi:hypothetical protein
VSLQVWFRLEVSRSLRLPGLLESRVMKVVRLSALSTGHFYPPGNISDSHICCSLYSLVGIATRYGLDGLGIEFRWGRDFPHPSIPALGVTQSSVSGYRVSFPGVMRPGRGVGPTRSSAEVKERVLLYLYSPSLGFRDLF